MAERARDPRRRRGLPLRHGAATDTEGLAEEQRLFYVAATRARDELRIYTPLRMPHHRRARDDRHSFAPESRFLTPEALCTLDSCENPRGPPAHPGTRRTCAPGGRDAVTGRPVRLKSLSQVLTVRYGTPTRDPRRHRHRRHRDARA